MKTLSRLTCSLGMRGGCVLGAWSRRSWAWQPDTHSCSGEAVTSADGNELTTLRNLRKRGNTERCFRGRCSA